jgi:Flp pilus assembly protein TadD
MAAERRFDESIAEATRGRQLDPVSPIITAGLAWVYHLAGRHAEAETQARLVLELEPDFVMGLMRLGVALRHQRSYAAADEALRRAVLASWRNPDILAELGQSVGLQGRTADAKAILEELDAMSRSRYVPPYDRALVHAGLGDRDAAFEWLGRARDQRYGLLALLAVDPDLDPLRDDPRFAKLAATIVPEPAR